MIYKINPDTQEVVEFQDINSISAAISQWADATEVESKAYEYKSIQKQYIDETTRRRNNIIEKGKIQITTDGGVLWHIKIDKNTVQDLLGAELLFRLVDGKTQGQFFNWNTGTDVIITYNDLKKLATEIDKYTNKVGGVKNIYTIQKQIISKVYEYTTYEAISSLEATQILHNELGRFDAIETELMMTESSTPTIIVPEQPDAGSGGRNL